ncbi:MAG: response regulator [Candidatus Acidiferrales bacterium]
MPNSIFIVDDNFDIRAGIRRQLELSGLNVCGEARDGLDALDKLSRVGPDLILDMSMPRMNGIDAARELKHICPNVPVILYTAFADVFRRKQVLPELALIALGAITSMKTIASTINGLFANAASKIAAP